jgi:4-alpha-glucanotransferase
VTTHDLPTAAGFLAGEHVRVRAELDQLGRPEPEERAAAEADRAALLALLRTEGLLDRDPDREQTVLAMHRLLTRTPARIVFAALGDAVGDLRQPNLPGTRDEYPNWRLPVAGPDGREIGLERLREHSGVLRLADALSAGLRTAR